MYITIFEELKKIVGGHLGRMGRGQVTTYWGSVGVNLGRIWGETRGSMGRIHISLSPRGFLALQGAGACLPTQPLMLLQKSGTNKWVLRKNSKKYRSMIGSSAMKLSKKEVYAILNTQVENPTERPKRASRGQPSWLFSFIEYCFTTSNNKREASCLFCP